LKVSYAKVKYIVAVQLRPELFTYFPDALIIPLVICVTHAPKGAPLGLLQDGDVRVGVFPDGEEVFVSS
jgi:hypothetical protein